MGGSIEALALLNVVGGEPHAAPDARRMVGHRSSLSHQRSARVSISFGPEANRMAMALEEAVSSVAVLIDDPEQFRARAAVVARHLGPFAIPDLSARFHSPLRPAPEGFGFEQCGLSGWLSIWQAAIFELFFQFGKDALPILRQVAFGEYDWTQSNAVAVLVRLAAAGIEREQTIVELRREFPNFRYEAKENSVGMVLYQAEHDEAIAAVARELEDLPEWRSAADSVRKASRA